MQRRELLKTAAWLPATALPMAAALAPAPARAKSLGEPQAFDFAWLKGRAQALANSAFIAPSTQLPNAIADLTWDQYQAIRFRPEHALWAKDGLPFQLRFFHPGLYFKTPVKLHEVVDGKAQEIAYQSSLFDFGKSGIHWGSLPENLGFAGFSVFFHTDPTADVAAFLGASYFRAVGGDKQYGMSTRGLAIDCGMDRAEEFPRFTDFWFEKPSKDSNRLTVYALMDSPSIAGAYRFDIGPGGTLIIDVDSALYPRKPIERLGIAPLTSMFLYGENDRRMATDWRPEIHDSDGLAMNTGAGEWIWRPLTNPVNLRFNAYADDNPRGFGLMQRDRNFDHYQDDGVFYDKRPSVWVEPRGKGASSGWGKGSVQLVEIPTIDETFDNIVAFWNPAEKPQPGEELLFTYRLYWGAAAPFAPALAQVVATRTGIGGVVGQKRQYFSWRFAVDFTGGSLALLGRDAKVEPVITASRGQIEITSARPQHEIGGYRAMFDLKPTDDSTQPIDLRLFLRLDGQPLTETWLYQWTPPAPADRKF
jgi:glucans biosynthesis protein